MVAIAQSNSKPPVIGKVLEVTEDTFKLCYWKGSWRKEWMPWKVGNELWVSDELPKSSIILVDFQFDSTGKLQSGTKKYLRREYQKIESTQNI
jgi:hypothetical protein